MFRLGEIIQAVGGRLYFSEPQLEVSGVSIDSRTIKRNELFIAIRGNHFDGHNFIQMAIRRGARAVIGSIHSSQLSVPRGVAYIKVADTRRALADLARFHRQRFNIPIIAVTGSNGKTTVKDMINQVLSSGARVIKNPGTQNNDIGVPLTLLKLDISHDVGVLELGTNHFGEIAYLAGITQPNFGIITNIGPAHLEFLKNLSGVYKEKVSLLKSLNPPKIAILNADEPRFIKLKNNKNAFIVTYGIKNKCDFQARAIKFISDRTIEFTVSATPSLLNKSLKDIKTGGVKPDRPRKIQLNTIGYVNVYNALAAIAVARLLGWDYGSISKSLATFVFPPGRLEAVKLNGISFIDDSYNANPASLSEALGVLNRFRTDGRKVFVMGDMLELGKSAEEFHRQAGIQIARVCDAFIGVGKLAKFTAHKAVRQGLSKERVFVCQDSQEAGRLLFKILKPKCRDLILIKGSRLMKMEEVLKFH